MSQPGGPLVELNVSGEAVFLHPGGNGNHDHGWAVAVTNVILYHHYRSDPALFGP